MSDLVRNPTTVYFFDALTVVDIEVQHRRRSSTYPYAHLKSPTIAAKRMYGPRLPF